MKQGPLRLFGDPNIPNRFNWSATYSLPKGQYTATITGTFTDANNKQYIAQDSAIASVQ